MPIPTGHSPADHRPLLVLFGLAAAGCGFAAQGPPAGHETMIAFNCTESTAGPVLDVVWGGLNLLGALGVAADRAAYEDPDQVIAVGLAWGVISTVAAVVGFSKTKRCREAKRLLTERRARGQLPGQGANAAGTDAELRAVVISPAADTLVIGERTQFTATAHSSSGASIPGREFFWSSSDATIASVSGAGLVTAHQPGEASIAARTGMVSAIARIVVIERP